MFFDPQNVPEASKHFDRLLVFVEPGRKKCVFCAVNPYRTEVPWGGEHFFSGAKNSVFGQKSVLIANLILPL